MWCSNHILWISKRKREEPRGLLSFWILATSLQSPQSNEFRIIHCKRCYWCPSISLWASCLWHIARLLSKCKDIHLFAGAAKVAGTYSLCLRSARRATELMLHNQPFISDLSGISLSCLFYISPGASQQDEASTEVIHSGNWITTLPFQFRFPLPDNCFLDHLQNKQLGLSSLSQTLFLGESKLRYSYFLTIK